MGGSLQAFVIPFSRRTTFSLMTKAIPATTSAEALPHYTGAKCLHISRGKAWRDLHAQINEEVREPGILTLPTVNEPFLCWAFSGEVEF
jgi:hypothetical protein